MIQEIFNHHKNVFKVNFRTFILFMNSAQDFKPSPTQKRHEKNNCKSRVS